MPPPVCIQISFACFSWCSSLPGILVKQDTCHMTGFIGNAKKVSNDLSRFSWLMFEEEL